MTDKTSAFPTSQRMATIAARNGKPNAAAVPGQKAGTAGKPAQTQATTKPQGSCSCQH